MIERFLLNEEDSDDGRMLVVELETCCSCLMAVYSTSDNRRPPQESWQMATTQAAICQFLQFNGCQNPLMLMSRIAKFARAHGAQFEELTPDDLEAFHVDQEKQVDSNNRPTLCPET